MAKRKRSAKAASRRTVPQGIASGERTDPAILIGRAQANEVLEIRKTQRARRARAIKRAELKGLTAAVSAAPIPISSLRMLGPTTNAGVLIAEGDSWFDYPLHDVLEMLEVDHGFDVESVAHRGDRVEDMAFSKGQLTEFARRLEKLLRNGAVPKAILLSGGGNDIAGSEFGVLLNHASSSIAGLNDDIVKGVIDQRIQTAYKTIIAAITRVCESFLNRPIPILVHGYDYAVPDGRGFWGGFWVLPGPWLEPGFREKGFADRAKNIGIMKDLMNRFNVMLKTMVSAPEFAHVRYINLRGTLSGAADYKKYWANELHPTERGFGLVAEKFAEVITGL